MKINPISYNYQKNNLKTQKQVPNVSFDGRNAVYAGSFDPITNGHLDLIKEASKLFDNLVVLVARNSKKQGLIPIDDRAKLIRESVQDLKNVSVDSYEGLTVNYAKDVGAEYLLRGMRSVSDFDNEMQISKVNEILAPDIKTVFLFSSSENSAISSSTVREIFANKGNFKRFVPEPVWEYLMRK